MLEVSLYDLVFDSDSFYMKAKAETTKEKCWTLLKLSNFESVDSRKKMKSNHKD